MKNIALLPTLMDTRVPMKEKAQFKGCLDGLTILRYAHAFDTGGGVEQHLADLNAELSRRNALTTIQMHLTLDAGRVAESQEDIGRSRLVKSPLLVDEHPSGGDVDYGGASARCNGPCRVPAVLDLGQHPHAKIFFRLYQRHPVVRTGHPLARRHGG